MNLRFGYTNKTRLQDQIVVKTFTGVDSRRRFATELSIYQQLQEEKKSFFIPDLVRYDEDSLTIGTRYIDKNHAQDLMMEYSHIIPFAIGKLAREILSLNVAEIIDQKKKENEVFVHGDFGPQNVLVDPNTLSEIFLVDWEWAHFGDEYEDVSWAEWIIRMHYDSNQQMIMSLYEGFGMLPEWEKRHTLMIRKCERILEFANKGDNEPAVSMWMDRLQIVKTFSEK